MDAWDKLDFFLANRFGEDGSKVALTGTVEDGSNIEITFADLRQIIQEGHPDN